MKSAKRQRKKANVMNNLDEHILSFWNRQHIQTWPKVCVRGKYNSLLFFQLLIFDPFKFALLELGRGGTKQIFNIWYIRMLTSIQISFCPFEYFLSFYT